MRIHLFALLAFIVAAPAFAELPLTITVMGQGTGRDNTIARQNAHLDLLRKLDEAAEGCLLLGGEPELVGVSFDFIKQSKGGFDQINYASITGRVITVPQKAGPLRQVDTRLAGCFQLFSGSATCVATLECHP